MRARIHYRPSAIGLTPFTITKARYEVWTYDPRSIFVASQCLGTFARKADALRAMRAYNRASGTPR